MKMYTHSARLAAVETGVQWGNLARAFFRNEAGGLDRNRRLGEDSPRESLEPWCTAADREARLRNNPIPHAFDIRLACSGLLFTI